MTSSGARSGLSGRAALWYVLASSYLVAAILLHRALTGTWGVNREFLALLVGVPSVQLVILELLRPHVQHGKSDT